MNSIERIRENIVFQNQFVQVCDDDVRFSDGSLGTYVRVAPPPGSGPGVVLLPVHRGRMCLVRTFRYPLGELQWGLPRGFGQADDPFETAVLELKEEVGTAAVQMELLGWLTPDSGLLTSRVAAMWVDALSASHAPTDTREVDEVQWVEIEDLWSRVATGQIQDGFTLAALCLAKALGRL